MKAIRFNPNSASSTEVAAATIEQLSANLEFADQLQQMGTASRMIDEAISTEAPRPMRPIEETKE